MYNTVHNLETLRRAAPSIFAEESAARTSDKYQHISTIKIVEGLVSKNFMPVWAKQSHCRTEDKRDHTKHMIRFRHAEARATESGLYPEIVLINSHDGSSSYRLMSGVFRVVCTNGLIAGTTYDDIRIRHQGDIVRNVIEGTYEVIENSNKMLTSAGEMSAIQLTEGEKSIFAETAHAFRFKDNELGQAISPIKLLSPRRWQERDKNDLFTVFNVVQENLIKGGIAGHAKDQNGRYRRVSTRAIKGIDQDTSLNRALWTLAEKMKQLKA